MKSAKNEHLKNYLLVHSPQLFLQRRMRRIDFILDKPMRKMIAVSLKHLHSRIFTT